MLPSAYASSVPLIATYTLGRDLTLTHPLFQHGTLALSHTMNMNNDIAYTAPVGVCEDFCAVHTQSSTDGPGSK